MTTELPGCKLFLVCVLVACVLGQVALADVGASTPDATSYGVALAAQTDGPTSNNTTERRHVNPPAVLERGNLTDARQWLAGRLSERLSASTVRLSQGEYERANDLLGEEYPSWLGMYVEVVGGTDSGTDDGSAETFEQAREEQTEYVSTVESFHETYRQYREAKRAGNESRARALARELDRLANSVDQNGSSLLEDYDRLANATDENFTTPARTVANVTENVTTIRSRVAEDEFIETRMRVERHSDRASFLDPVAVAGRLVNENGSALINGMIELRLDDRTATTITNDTGHFDVTLRPRTARTGNRTVFVRYLPANRSQFAGTTERRTVRIEQVEPNVSTTTNVSSVSFGTQLSLSGTVDLDDIDARDVPVAYSVDGERLGTTRTDADGQFSTVVTVSATVSAGDRTVRTRVDQADRALAPATGTAALDVEPTATEVTLRSVRLRNGSSHLVVGGRLSTPDGRPVGDQSIRLAVAGTTVDIASTNASGAFETTVSLPNSVASPRLGERSVRLTARYAASGTNLRPSQSSETVTLPADVGGWLSANFAVVLGTVGVVALLVVVAYTRQRRDTGPDEDGPAGMGVRRTDAPEPDTERESPVDLGTFVGAAEGHRQAGNPREAIRTAYSGVRWELARTRPREGSHGTHWEFFEACRRDDLSTDEVRSLRLLTEQYERATYAADSASDSAARTALDLARAFGRGESTERT